MNADNKSFDMIFKIILIGDSGVGKTNILSKFIKNEFEERLKPTVGVEFGSKNFTIDGYLVKAQIWDTAGEERYRSITSAYYKGAKGCLLVYSITDRRSFDNIDKWIEQLKGNSDEDLCIILVGNKIDIEDFVDVKTEEGMEKAKSLNIPFMETSALNNQNIDKVFQKLIEEVYEKNNKIFRKNISLVVDNENNNNEENNENKENEGITLTQGESSGRESKRPEYYCA